MTHKVTSAAAAGDLCGVDADHARREPHRGTVTRLPNGPCSGEAVGGLEDAARQLDGCVRGGERVLAVDEDGR